MLLALVPSINLGAITQINSGNISPFSLEKSLSPQEVGASTVDDIDTANSNFGSDLSSISTNVEGFPTISQPRDFGYQSSIKGLPNVSDGQVAVLANGETVFSSPTVTDITVSLALNYLYVNGSNNTDYVLYIGV